MEYLLKECEYEHVIVDNDEDVSQDLVETEMHASFQVPDVLASTEGRMNEYVIEVRKPEYELLLESKAKVHRHQMNYVEGDVFTSIKDVWVAEKVECNQQIEDEITELKQTGDLRSLDNAEIKETKSEGFESDDVEMVMKQQQRRYS